MENEVMKKRKIYDSQIGWRASMFVNRRRNRTLLPCDISKLIICCRESRFVLTYGIYGTNVPDPRKQFLTQLTDKNVNNHATKQFFTALKVRILNSNQETILIK